MVNSDLRKFWSMKPLQERHPYVSRKPLCLQSNQFNTISLRLTGVELYFHTFVTLLFVKGEWTASYSVRFDAE
jgi:hypothetical protein